jgi:2-oxoglutarate ferredoxin oxidoreductase subunit alpha
VRHLTLRKGKRLGRALSKNLWPASLERLTQELEREQLKTIEQTASFWSGNEACVQGAIMAGCRFFAGYPITPSNEIPERLSELLPRVGGIFMQMEDELASIGAVMGASWAGRKAMTATSGPGFSLMQETIGWGFMTETPCVVVDVQRVGPGTGQATKGSQGDVMQARWGAHGDYSAIVLSPNSVQEMFEMTVRAFNLAERYRTPVILLADETIAHLREQVTVPQAGSMGIVDRVKPERGESAFFGSDEVAPMPSVGEGFNVAVTASTHDEKGARFTQDAKVHRRMVEAINAKISKHVADIVEVECSNVDGCEVGVVSYGCTSRAAYEAIERAGKRRDPVMDDPPEIEDEAVIARRKRAQARSDLNRRSLLLHGSESHRKRFGLPRHRCFAPRDLTPAIRRGFEKDLLRLPVFPVICR